MSETATLSIAPFEHSAMDYAFLRQEGIRHLERMAGHLWTDFNAHDPGITVLEQLCYAITDLAYRIAYDVPDLLAGGGEDASHSLYSPATILTSDPVTLTDLRKLILDVRGVKNAWLEKVETPAVDIYYHEGKQQLTFQSDGQYTEPVLLKGLYRVLIEKSELLDLDSATVQRDVARRLHAHRPLCTDFVEIRVLETQPIQIQATIEIGQVDNAEDVLLAIYLRLSDYISPSIPFHALTDMLAMGKRSDEIFEGPALQRGFIDSKELERSVRKPALHTSDLIRTIMDVPGVNAVRFITVSADSRAPEAWVLDLDTKRTPKLDLDKSKIELMRGRLTASLDVEKVKKAYVEQRKSSAVYDPLPLAERDVLPPKGRDRQVGNYYSIQHQFPALYGIGDLGLPESASAQRKAEAKQLKAYLLFFDQLLANYFAQLAHVKQLFSFHGSDMRMYFAQMIDDPSLGLDEVRTRGANEHRARLDAITESTVQSGSSSKRKNRFLNHLIARFAEQFTDYSLVLFGTMDAGQQSANDPVDTGQVVDDRLVRDKQAFLRDYPQLSSARGTGFDYLEPWSNRNLSGLEARIRRKLGFHEQDDERFFVVEHVLLRPVEEDRPPQGENELRRIPLLAASPYKDPYSLQLSVVFPRWAGRLDKSDNFRRLVEQTVREETPAHLVPYVHWLDKDEWTRFEGAYKHWADKQRIYWSVKLGS